jgi:hypothetical protein
MENKLESLCGGKSMDTLKLKTHIGDDGVLKLELQTGVVNRDLEVLIVLQALETQAVDDLGWPVGFFDRTYGALADDPIERPAELPPDVRDSI